MMPKKNLVLENFMKMQDSPLYFVERMWGLYSERDNEKFVKGKHLTWQQHDILKKVGNAIKGTGKKRISVKSGHGIGKSTLLSWLILWYLFCYKDSQVPCTAPTSDQMHDVLWKEVYKWLLLMPFEIQELYEWSNGYIRMKLSPQTWFARAKTARRDSPEALAGVHGDYVMFIIDEASGVPDEVFSTAEGALTGENVLVVMISNPTRLVGYFYDSHRKDSEAWEKLSFSSIDSPVVEDDYEERIKTKYGEDSDEYRIRVLGEFPREDTMDEKGYVQLFFDSDLKFMEKETSFIGKDLVLGIDPAGEGSDETIWVLRDHFKAKIIAREKVSNSKSIAQKTMTLMEGFGVQGGNVYVDNFGTGANVAQEMAMNGIRINGVNVGDLAYDKDTFMNLRAEAYWKSKKWIREGGELIKNEGWDELLYIRYRKEISGKMKIMSKREMKKFLGRSPDHADALMLTFVRPSKKISNKIKKRIKNLFPSKGTYNMRMA